MDTKDIATGMLKQIQVVLLPATSFYYFYPIRISPNPAKPFALIGDPNGDGVYKIDLVKLRSNPAAAFERIAGPLGLGTGHDGTNKIAYTDIVFHESGNYAYSSFCESTQCILPGVGLIDVFGLSNGGTPSLTIQGGTPPMVAYSLQYNPAYHRLYVSYAYNLYGLRTLNVSPDGSTVQFEASYSPVTGNLPDFIASLAVPQIPIGANLHAIVTTKSGAQSACVWPITLTNDGSALAQGAQIDSLTNTPVAPATCTPTITSPNHFPLFVGDVAVGASASANVAINFTGCGNADRFTTVINFSANGGALTGSKTLTQYR